MAGLNIDGRRVPFMASPIVILWQPELEAFRMLFRDFWADMIKGTVLMVISK
jgi:hypothetical protein